MASKKITRRAHKALDGVEEEAVMELYIKERTVAKMLWRVKEKTGVDISPGLLYQWLHHTDERWQNWQGAKRLIADLLVDESYNIAHNHEPDEVQSARLKTSVNQWIAERYNKPAYGRNEAGASVTMTFSEEFMDALKASGERRRIAPEEVPETDYEILDEHG